jgi:hypothetical protein
MPTEANARDVIVADVVVEAVVVAEKITDQQQLVTVQRLVSKALITGMGQPLVHHRSKDRRNIARRRLRADLRNRISPRVRHVTIRPRGRLRIQSLRPAQRRAASRTPYGRPARRLAALRGVQVPAVQLDATNNVR